MTSELIKPTSAIDMTMSVDSDIANYSYTNGSRCPRYCNPERCIYLPQHTLDDARPRSYVVDSMKLYNSTATDRYFQCVAKASGNPHLQCRCVIDMHLCLRSPSGGNCTSENSRYNSTTCQIMEPNPPEALPGSLGLGITSRDIKVSENEESVELCLQYVMYEEKGCSIDLCDLSVLLEYNKQMYGVVSSGAYDICPTVWRFVVFQVLVLIGCSIF